jgi:hypothetical protein
MHRRGRRQQRVGRVARGLFGDRQADFLLETLDVNSLSGVMARRQANAGTNPPLSLFPCRPGRGLGIGLFL